MNNLIKTLILIVFCSIYCDCYAQQDMFNWTDNKTSIHWEIDPFTSILKQEIQPGEWRAVGLLKLDKSALEDLPPYFLTNSFLTSNGKRRFFTISGTQQVFEFDKSNSTLTRLDKTYYRGYNFDSYQFMRRDTIYSFGGEGFWQLNATLTYYDWNLREWEWLRAKNEGPKVITSYLSGYDPETDVFYTALNPYPNQYGQKNPNRDGTVFSLNLKTNKWELLGHVDENSILNKEPIVWSGRYFLQCNDNFLLVIDPEENKVFEYKDGKSIFNGVLNINGEVLTTKYVKFSKVIVENFNIKNVLSKANYIGAFYSTSSASSLKFYIISALSTAVIFLIFYLTFKKKLIFWNKNINQSSPLFSDIERSVLDSLLSKGKTGTLSILELNSILNINGKSPDNQRKIRSDFLSHLNQKIELKHNITNCIDKKPLEEDKRMYLYFLSDKGFQFFSKTIFQQSPT
jgi:hypothetical protein